MISASEFLLHYSGHYNTLSDISRTQAIFADDRIDGACERELPIRLACGKKNGLSILESPFRVACRGLSVSDNRMRIIGHA